MIIFSLVFFFFFVCVLPFFSDTDCQWEGKTYSPGANWQSDPCTECTCSGGVARCIARSCPPPRTCPPGQALTPIEGECCWKCRPPVPVTGERYVNEWRMVIPCMGLFSFLFFFYGHIFFDLWPFVSVLSFSKVSLGNLSQKRFYENFLLNRTPIQSDAKFM